MIKNYDDLAQLFNASEASEDAISSRVYKSTQCGAWAALTTITPEKATKRIYEVNFVEEGGFVKATRWRPYHKGWRPFTHTSTPKELVDYLEGEPDSGELRLPDEFSSIAGLIKTASVNDDMITFKQPVGNRVTGQIRLNQKRQSTPRLAVQFGSIVEGVDFCTQTVTVELPATDKRIMQALSDVEQEAAYIWEQTHGCNDCGTPDSMGEFDGYIAVNPECETCHGDGTIL